jgi:hypothetical protein
MNVGIGAGAVQFHFWEYMFLIFGILSLQCIPLRQQEEKDRQNTPEKVLFYSVKSI